MVKIKKEIIKRVKNETFFLLQTEHTIREIAKIFNVSKSTVHKDLKYRLKEIDKTLFLCVDKILKKHIDLRHIKGGEATKKKYLRLKKSLT